MVAKANCYGLGAKKICKEVNDLVDCFAVSSADEFYEIHKVVSKPIMILCPIYHSKSILKAARFGAILCVSNKTNIDLLIRLASVHGETNFNVQIAFNTGMNRFGFKNVDDIIDAVKELRKYKNICIKGIFSHHFCTNLAKICEKQNKKLLELKDVLKCLGLENLCYHIESSNSIVTKNFDMIRSGFYIYDDKFNSTVTLKSKIIDIQFLNKNETAGYNEIFRAENETKLAIVAIGYGDGLFRKLTQNGYVIISDTMCKIVAVCMDSILVDATNVNCSICDDVTLIGKSKSHQIFICDLAAWCDTIGYEIISHITKRVKRKYIEG